MNMNDKNKALLKLFGSVIKDTGKLLIDPYIGNTSSIIEGLVVNSKSVYDEMNKKKLYELYMGIEKLDDDTEKTFTRENLAFLIKKIIQDDEINKTHFYSKLAINISKSDIPDEERIDFISTLSNLTAYDIDFMRKLYIHNVFDLKGFNNNAEQLLSITETHAGREIKSINKLYSNGLIFEPNRGKAASQYYQPTEYLNTFITMLFDHQELIPAAINENEKNKSDIFFLQNSEYMSDKPYYDALVIQSLDDLGYTTIINTDIYGPYNDKSSIYISIDNDIPFVNHEDGKRYLRLIIEVNRNIFFDKKTSDHPRYLVCVDEFNESVVNNKNTSTIRESLRFHIEDVKKLMVFSPNKD